MGRKIRIGQFEVGGGCPAFIIAEAGCNHENSFERACEMLIETAKGGAQAFKLQSFTPEKLVTRTAGKFWDIPGCPGQTQLEEFEEIKPNFTREQYVKLSELASRHGILFFSTPCDEDWADYLENLGVALYKVMSMDITHIPLLRHIARKRKPVVLSTGASTIAEIREAVDAIHGEGNQDVALLHCVSSYPAPLDQVHLRMIGHIQREFPDCVIGYSDHTLPDMPVSVPAAAVALGAKVIEKHFTFDAKRPGYDHEISADYPGLRHMVAGIRQVESMLGDAQKHPVPAEERARQMGRRSVVAAVDISKGAVLSAEMLSIKRPGTGIAPKHLPELLGRRAAIDIKSDDLLSWESLA